MAVTVKDVARLAGVSISTVSRVINDDPRISSETKQKVRECIDKLNYKVNSIARSLKTNKSYTVGFICPEISNDFFMNVAKGVEDELRNYGYSVMICSSNESADEEESRIKLLCEKCVDGLIIIPASNTGKHYSIISELKIPLVLVDRLLDDFSADAVLSDNINGCYSAVEHLLNTGFRRIGFIGGDMRLTSAKERLEGYSRALKDYCVPADEDIIKFGDFHAESGYSLMKEMMNTKRPPEYIFIANRFMHMGAARYLLENSYAGNERIPIAAFDNMEMSTMLGLCKVYVEQPMTDIGSRAAELLVGRINGEATTGPQVFRMKTRLITGG